ncbi:type II restriction-modification system restriction subunit [Synechococcus phage S-CAM7]|uniref:Type II restriction-modification system restriction subunit n=1 Tax=Synechococcus phage S-CAM7 TaxID=1883368 RepID=A0A1D8KTM6_9CAUD|nr:type II restriction-modification system restriction subunit [Synechococcus phage S-CAM7]AOV61979.1 type II restriction-modification system restriction subunit [Synechococcus phage S-CAM7]
MQIIPGVDNAFGFGDTEDTYEQRQKGSDYSKVGGYGFALGQKKWTTHGWWEDQTVIDRAHHQDKEVHKFIMTFPTMRKKDEVFTFEKSSGLTLDIIKHKIDEQFFSGETTNRVELTPRKHQSEFLAKVQAEYLEFLLFAKCRAGKSIMSLLHVKERGYKVTLIVARMTSPKGSWESDSRGFTNFDNMIFIDLQGNKNYAKEIEYWTNTNKQVVLFDTVQGAISKDFNIDFLIYDEAHIGAKDTAKQWKSLRSMIDCPILYVTGTAYKMADDFSEDNKFVYSYFEEQLDKKNGLIERPSMNVILAKYETEEYQAIYGDDPDAMKNLFQMDGSKFAQPALVSEFIKMYFMNDRSIRKFSDRLLNDSNHIYMTLPSVAACYAFSELLASTRFAPLVVTGDSKKSNKDISKHIQENPTGSIVITRTANVLGVTADVDTVMNCAEGSSIEFWTQFAFRGGSGDNDWRVIDFAPQRCLESLREMYVLACENAPTISEFELLDYVNVTEWDRGFETLTQEQVENILGSDPAGSVRLISGLTTALNVELLAGMGFNANLTPVDSNIAKQVVVNDNEANGKGALSRTSTPEEKEKAESLRREVMHVQAILERIPLSILHSHMLSTTITGIDSLITSEAYLNDTSDYDGVLAKYMEKDQSFYQRLNRRVAAVSLDIKAQMNRDLVQTLDKLSISATAQMPIPATLLTEMHTSYA